MASALGDYRVGEASLQHERRSTDSAGDVNDLSFVDGEGADGHAVVWNETNEFAPIIGRVLEVELVT